MKWILLLLFPLQVHSHSTERGNGGDAILQEFNLRGIQLAAYFKAEPQVASDHGIDPARFLRIVKSTNLESHEELFLNGTEVDAINHPSTGIIEVSRKRWKESASREDAYFVQRRIALHEYLWIYGINDERYAISNSVIAGLEHETGRLLDEDTHRTLVNKFCLRMWEGNFAGAQTLLSWGIDLNRECNVPGISTNYPYHPLDVLFMTYWQWPVTDALNSVRFGLLRKMLEFGLDPNQMNWKGHEEFMLLQAQYTDFEAVELLFEFGANPNLMDNGGYSLFAQAAQTAGLGEMNVDLFKAYIEAGGDVNAYAGERLQWSWIRTPAREIVSKENNAAVVEALIQTGQTDWCTDYGGWNKRTLDQVRPEYQQILQKFGVQCP